MAESTDLGFCRRNILAESKDYDFAERILQNWDLLNKIKNSGFGIYLPRSKDLGM